MRLLLTWLVVTQISLFTLAADPKTETKTIVSGLPFQPAHAVLTSKEIYFSAYTPRVAEPRVNHVFGLSVSSDKTQQLRKVAELPSIIELYSAADRLFVAHQTNSKSTLQVLEKETLVDLEKSETFGKDFVNRLAWWKYQVNLASERKYGSQTESMETRAVWVGNDHPALGKGLYYAQIISAKVGVNTWFNVYIHFPLQDNSIKQRKVLVLDDVAVDSATRMELTPEGNILLSEPNLINPNTRLVSTTTGKHLEIINTLAELKLSTPETPPMADPKLIPSTPNLIRIASQVWLNVDPASADETASKKSSRKLRLSDGKGISNTLPADDLTGISTIRSGNDHVLLFSNGRNRSLSLYGVFTASSGLETLIRPWLDPKANPKVSLVDEKLALPLPHLISAVNAKCTGYSLTTENATETAISKVTSQGDSLLLTAKEISSVACHQNTLVFLAKHVTLNHNAGHLKVSLSPEQKLAGGTTDGGTNLAEVIQNPPPHQVQSTSKSPLLFLLNGDTLKLVRKPLVATEFFRVRYSAEDGSYTLWLNRNGQLFRDYLNTFLADGTNFDALEVDEMRLPAAAEEHLEKLGR